MLHKSIARFSICQCICAEVGYHSAWALTRQGKYDNLMMYIGCVNKFARHVYFLANIKYANELLKHMSRGCICTCPPCSLFPACSFRFSDFTRVSSGVHSTRNRPVSRPVSIPVSKNISNDFLVRSTGNIIPERNHFLDFISAD